MRPTHCFYCEQELEDGAVVRQETFLRNDLSESTWIWHEACEPADCGPKPEPSGVIEEDWRWNALFLGAHRPRSPGRLLWFWLRARTLFTWNVMDRLRYWGLWPSRYMAGYRERFPVRTIWGDMQHWARTAGTCMVLGHVRVEWFNPAPYAVRYKCARCDGLNV